MIGPEMASKVIGFYKELSEGIKDWELVRDLIRDYSDNLASESLPVQAVRVGGGMTDRQLAVFLGVWVNRLQAELTKLNQQLPEDIERHPQEKFSLGFEGPMFPLGPRWATCLDGLRKLHEEFLQAQTALQDPPPITGILRD